MIKPAIFYGGHRSLVTDGGQLVLVFTADAKTLGHVLGGYAHVVKIHRASQSFR